MSSNIHETLGLYPHCLQCLPIRQRPTPPVHITSTLLKTRTIDILHTKHHMPNLLKHPSYPKAIRQVRFRRPRQHPLIVPLGPLQDPLPGDGKLPAADIPDMLGDALLANSKQRLVHLGKVRADILLVDIDLSRGPGVHICRTAWVVLAAEIDVALCGDGLEAEIAQRDAGFGAEEVVVPLVLVRVDEDGVGGKLVVEVDDVGEVGGCFAAAAGVWDEEVRGGFVVGGVDEGDGVAVLSSISIWLGLEEAEGRV